MVSSKRRTGAEGRAYLKGWKPKRILKKLSDQMFLG